MYPPYYIEPLNKKEQDNLKASGEAEKLASVPIRAAKNEQTCSVFYDNEINKFTNYVMRKGKKDLARSLVEKTFENIKRIQLKKFYSETDETKRAKITLNPRVIFHEAIRNCQPVLQLTPVKRGGANYQVPVPITEKRAKFLAMNWLIEVSQDTPKEIHFPDTLARELLDAAKNTGKVVKRKIDLHRQCEANRAYAHYRWG